MAELVSTLGDQDRLELAKRAKKINPDLARSIEQRVAERIELARELNGQRVVRLEPEHQPTPPSARLGRSGMTDEEAAVECELTQLNKRGDSLAFFWCRGGQHVWSREPRVGHPPHSCPSHNNTHH